MGKKDKKKDKKVKGSEKTAKKTEKNSKMKLKKELKLKGEEDIEKILADIVEHDRQRQAVTEEVTGPPSPRSSFSLSPHPEKDELLLFGGEFFNGSKTFVYNDLYVYNTRKDEWSLLSAPNPPPPRCGHQAVSLSQDGGQLWIFGGEFTSATQSQFYHYKDLWVFHLRPRRWEKVAATGGPSARSGHRMVVCKKQLIVFGGFHDNSRDYKYFNDVYAFNLGTYKWQKLEVPGTGPSPRSGCQMASLSDGRVLLYGGYSKEKMKKDVDKGTIHHDMFCLQPNKNDLTGTKWNWIRIKQSGMKPSPRCSCSIAVFPNSSRAYVFGGVCDEENEETLEGTFYNDLYQLELDNGKWHMVGLNRVRNPQKKIKCCANSPDGGKSTDDEDETADVSDTVEQLHLRDNSISMDQQPHQVTTSVDGIFTVTVFQQQSKETDGEIKEANKDAALDHFVPLPRMNAGLVIKHGILYIYGGMYEVGEKTVTFTDLHSLDLRKLDEWHTIIPHEDDSQEWIDSETSEEEEGDINMEEEDEEEEDSSMEEDDGNADANNPDSQELSVSHDFDETAGQSIKMS